MALRRRPSFSSVPCSLGTPLQGILKRSAVPKMSPKRSASYRSRLIEQPQRLRRRSAVLNTWHLLRTRSLNLQYQKARLKLHCHLLSMLMTNPLQLSEMSRNLLWPRERELLPKVVTLKPLRNLKARRQTMSQSIARESDTYITPSLNLII